jgi:AcrR family transcriptional regulator
MSRCFVSARRQNVPEALLEAIGESIREHGASALSLRDVARRVGVSHAAPAHFFKNKAGMLSAFAAQGFRRLADVVEDELDRSKAVGGAQALASIGRAYVRFAVAEPSQFEVMFRLDVLDATSSELQEASDRAFSLLITTIEQCRQEGSLGDRDEMLVALAAWSIAHGLASLWISGQLEWRIAEANIETLASSVSQLFVDAVLGRD